MIDQRVKTYDWKCQKISLKMSTACITFNPAEMTETVTSTHTALSILMTENVNKEKAFTNMYQMQTPTPMMNKIMNNSKEEKITGVTSEILKQIMKNQEQFNRAIVNFLDEVSPTPRFKERKTIQN